MNNFPQPQQPHLQQPAEEHGQFEPFSSFSSLVVSSYKWTINFMCFLGTHALSLSLSHFSEGAKSFDQFCCFEIRENLINPLISIQLYNLFPPKNFKIQGFRTASQQPNTQYRSRLNSSIQRQSRASSPLSKPVQARRRPVNLACFY